MSGRSRPGRQTAAGAALLLALLQPAATAAASALDSAAGAGVSGPAVAGAEPAESKAASADPGSEDQEAAGSKRWERFPSGMIFPRPVADPRTTRNHLGLAYYSLKADNLIAGQAGFATDFPLYRRTAAAPPAASGEVGPGRWQISVSGGINALFDMASTSRNLVDADFIIGLPVTYQRGEWAFRGRYYHLSAHQGDDYIFENETDIVLPYRNISFETVEAAAAWSRGPWTAYGMAACIVRTGPEIDGRWRLQAGFQGLQPVIPGRGFGLLGGIDVQTWNATDWTPDVTAKFGLYVPSSRRSSRSLQVLFEASRGHVPYFQLYDLKYWGVGAGIAFTL